MDVGPQCGKGFLEAGRAVDDGEFRRLQATVDKVIEKCPPGGFALPAHILDRQKNLLAVLPDAERDEQRDGRCFPVEPHAHHRPVEDQPDDRLIGERTAIPSVPIAPCLAPNPADRVLPRGAAGRVLVPAK